MTEIRVNEEELRNCIKEIDVYKSSSVDNLSSRVLKDAFLVMIPQMTQFKRLGRKVM